MVRAKTAGLVLAVAVKPGQRVQESDALVRLASLQQLWLDIQVPADRQAATLTKNGQIQVSGRDVQAVPLQAVARLDDQA